MRRSAATGGLRRELVCALVCALICTTLYTAGCGGSAAKLIVDSSAHHPPETPDLQAFRLAPATTKPTFRLIFRTPGLASRLAVLGACFRAQARAQAHVKPGGDTASCALLRQRLNATGRAHLRAFGAARGRYVRARAAPMPSRDPAHPLDATLLPPAQLQASEAFAEAFFRFSRLSDALADLNLPAADQAAITATFAWFAPPLNALCARLRQQRPEVALAATARWAKLAPFLARLARFYGVSARLPAQLHIDLVWSPEHNLRATAWAGRAVVPLSQALLRATEITAARMDLARVLGVVVHEFGHVFASLLPRKRRQALTDRITGEAGLPNLHHNNLIDEAMQTAAGNVLFLRSLPQWVKLDTILYAHEPRQRYPAAIDQLARHLAPRLARYLAIEAAFDGPFFDVALRTQIAVFGRAPLSFARAAVVIATNPRASKLWRRLLPGMHQTTLTTGAPTEAWLARNPWLTRWWLTLVDTRPRPARDQRRSAAQRAATKCVRHGAAACFIARQRASAAGWDLAVAAVNLSAMDRLLQRLTTQTSLADLRLPTNTTTAATRTTRTIKPRLAACRPQRARPPYRAL